MQKESVIACSGVETYRKRVSEIQSVSESMKLDGAPLVLARWLLAVVAENDSRRIQVSAFDPADTGWHHRGYGTCVARRSPSALKNPPATGVAWRMG